jgi:hypothetical protein
MIINRSIGFIPVQKLQLKIVNKLQISGSKLRQISVITSQGGVKISLCSDVERPVQTFFR